MGLFRVIYKCRTHLRLMQTAAGDPATWRFEMPSVPDDPRTIELEVRDIVDSVGDVPVHQGLEIAITVTGDNIDDAIATGFKNADTLTLLVASARATAEPLQPLVALDVTPGLAERMLVQWFPDVNLPFGKTPVPLDAFGNLFERIPALDEKQGARLMISLAWHRQALRETEPLFRFLTLWIAFEALEPRLAEHYVVQGGFPGLRRLALLRNSKPYNELGADYFNNLDTTRIQRHHVRRLEQLGYKVSLIPVAA